MGLSKGEFRECLIPHKQRNQAKAPALPTADEILWHCDEFPQQYSHHWIVLVVREIR